MTTVKIFLSLILISLIYSGCENNITNFTLPPSNEGLVLDIVGCKIDETDGLSGYFVSAIRSDDGIGTKESPLSLSKAMSSSSPVLVQNKTIWVCPGIYRGSFESNLYSSEDNIIKVKKVPNTRVVLDSNVAGNTSAGLLINGSWTEYYGFEVLSSNRDRESSQNSSGPSDVSLLSGVIIFASNTKIINFIVHDTAQGFSFWSTAINSELYGNIIYNNGWTAPGRGHGHAIYTQNFNDDTYHGIKKLRDNIIFFGFGTGIHAYTEGGGIDGFEISDNVWFTTGASDPRANQRKDNCLVGGFQPIDRLNIEKNLGFSKGRGTRIGYGGNVNNISAILKNNYLAEDLWIHGNWDSFSLQNNEIFGSILNQNSITSDINNTIDNSRPTSGTKIFIKENEYDENRARITIYNWDNKDNVSIDLSSVLSEDERYQIYSVFDLFGSPIVEGTFSSNNIEIPMGSVTPPQPNGLDGIEESDNPDKVFGTFILKHR